MMRKAVSLFLALLLLASACTLALAEETPIITIAVADATNIEDYNTNDMTLMLEEALGIDIQFEVYPATDYNTKINMMIATGGNELPDVLFVTPTDAELLTWIDSGMIIPLTEYYNDANIAVHINEAIKRCGVDFTKQVTMFDGNIYSIPVYNQSYSNEYSNKLWMNSAFVEQLGIEAAPSTPEELYDLLVAVKNTDLNGNGKNDEIGMVGTFSENSYDGWFRYIMNAYVYAGDNDYYTVTDGTVGVAYSTEAWKEGLKFIQKLFAEELIPKEILTQDGNQFLAMLNSEEPTCMMYFFISPSRVNANLEWRNDMVAYEPMINQTTSERWTSYVPSAANNGSFFITANCEEPEIAFKLGDTMVSKYYSIMSRWGIEGQDWDFVVEETASKYVPMVPGAELTIVVYDDPQFWASGNMQNRSLVLSRKRDTQN